MKIGRNRLRYAQLLSVTGRKRPVSLFVLLLLYAVPDAWGTGPASSTTTLTITSGGTAVTTVATPGVVTLTAATTSGGTAVTQGVVNFCYSTQLSCSGAALVGTAQLTTAGTASISFRPAVGSHSYEAVFMGTGSVAASKSAASTLAVTQGSAPVMPTMTAIASSGSAGDYTLTGTVTGDSLTVPTGSVNFIDLTRSKAVVGTATLGGATSGPGFLMPPATTDFTNAFPIVAGDFNGDGIPDLIAFLSDSSVASLLGNGDGSFTNHATIPAGGTIPAVTGDFNSDGKLDLAIAGSGGVQVFLGDGAGGFTAVPGSPSIAINQIASLAVGDFNQDGVLDLALTDGQTVYVYTGVGDGTFKAGYNFFIVPSSVGIMTPGSNGLAVGDFNADGHPDLAVAWINTFSPSQLGTDFNISFFFGDGTGNFTTSNSSDVTLPVENLVPPVPFQPVGSGPPFALVMVASDVNGDGKTDLTASVSLIPCCPEFQGTGTFTVLNNGNGTFTTSGGGGYTLGPPLYAAALDLNGDGTTQITTWWESATPGLPSGGGEPAHIDYGNGSLALPNGVGSGFVTGDFNGDGIPDIALGGPVATSLVGYQTVVTGTAAHVAVSPGGSGMHQVEASYPGDAIHAASVSTTVSLDSGLATPTVVISAPSSIAYGGTATLTATVTSGGATPTGMVTFLSGTTTLGSSALSKGVATLPVSNLAPGMYSITAAYSGDANDAAATSTAVTLTVTKASSMVTISAPVSIAYGGTATLTATVTSGGAAPTGTVTFLSGTTTLGSSPLSKGVATLPVSNLAPGMYSITAAYSGDANDAAATSAAVTLTVTKASSTITISAPGSIAFGSAATLTATVASGATPTGTVTFLSGTTTLGSSTLSNGVATLPVSNLTPGMYSITATYSGDANNAAATSAAVTVTVTKASSTIVLTASAATITVGAPETLVVTLPAGDATGGGTVTFYLGSAMLGSSAVSGGSAKLTTSTLPAGKDSVTAPWTGDKDFSGSTSAAVEVMVAPSLDLTSSSGTIYAGVSDSIKVVLGTGSNTVVPTGTITLSSGSYTSAAAALSGGSATVAIPANTLPAGNDTLMASYSGDAVYPAGSGSLVVMVSTDPPPGFTISAHSLTIAAGATTGNTVAITLTPVTGFTGTVNLAAQVTSSPANAHDPPKVSFGSSNAVSITGNTAVTATLTVTTTATTMTRIDSRRWPDRMRWLTADGAVLACVFFAGIPWRRRRLLRRMRNLALLPILLMALVSAFTACGGGSHKTTVPGTTSGAYTVTVTGTSGAVTSTSTVMVTVQ